MEVKKGVTVNTKDEIIELLVSTKRAGMPQLIEELLLAGGFFESPASTKYHRSYPGGMAEHSLGVYKLLIKYCGEFKFRVNPGAIIAPVCAENIIIAALLHDVCKIGAYIGSEPPYKWNRNQPKGHALLSILRIVKYVTLEPIEELMIKFHMGPYGAFEFEGYAAEYPLKGDDTKSKEERYGQSLRNVWYHNPVVKLMYICDELEMFSEGR